MHQAPFMPLLPTAHICLLLLYFAQIAKPSLATCHQLVAAKTHFPVLIDDVASKPCLHYFVAALRTDEHKFATNAHPHLPKNASEAEILSRNKKQTNSLQEDYDSTQEEFSNLSNLNVSPTKEELDELRSQFELLEPLRTERISYAIAYGVIVVLSFFGNALVCNVCLKNMTKTNALIMSLAVSDLMMTLFNIPFSYFRLLNYSWPFGRLMCFLINFVQHLVVYTSSYTMAIIAIQRYRSVCGLRLESSSKHTPRVSVDNVECQLAPRKVLNWCKATSAHLVECCHFNWLWCRPKKKKLFSKRAICSSILLTWTLSALISILFTYTSKVVAKEDVFALLVSLVYQKKFETTTSNNTQEQDDPTKEHSMHFVLRCQNKVPLSVEHFLSHYKVKADFAKTVVVFVTQYFIPLSISCCLYIRIGKIITRQGKIATLRGNPKARIREKKKRRRIVMLVLVVTVFAITWAPLHIFHILTDAGLLNWNYEIFMMVHWLAMSSVSYNPFIYCWLNKSFRKAALRVFCCCWVEEEFTSTSGEDNTLERSNARSGQQRRLRSRFLDKVPCCARRLAIQSEPQFDRPSPTTTTSQLPMSTENGLGTRSLLCAHMQSNFSVATESSVIAFASMERLADLEMENEHTNQVQITFLPLNKSNKNGLSFTTNSRRPRSGSALPSSGGGALQIKVQDCSHICASTSELSYDEDHKEVSSLSQTSSRLNSPEDDEDDAVLNEGEEHRLRPCHARTQPLELRPITRSSALFGGMDGYNSICRHQQQDMQCYPANTSQHSSPSEAPRKINHTKSMLTTDL